MTDLTALRREHAHAMHRMFAALRAARAARLIKRADRETFFNGRARHWADRATEIRNTAAAAVR